MKVLVLIKQVPDVARLRLNEADRRLVRGGVELFANPFDLRALALSLRLKAERGATVTAATMGPPQARGVLEFGHAAGADAGILISDPRLAGSDTLATARVLAALVRREEPDLVVAGQYSVDSETGQVPEELATMLGWPCLAAVREFDYDAAARAVRVGCETDEGMEWARAPLPLVLTTAERLMPPAKVPPEQVQAARDRPIVTLGLDDLGLPAAAVGEAGSPTRVEAIKTVTTSRVPLRVEVSAAEDLARAVVPALRDRLGAAASGRGRSRPDRATAKSLATVWALLERQGERLSAGSVELLGLARRLGTDPVGVALAGVADQALARQALAHGARRAVVATSPLLDPPTSETWSVALDELLERGGTPDLVLASATRIGRGTLSRLAARRDLGLTGDCIGVEAAADGTLLHLKPAFGGNVVAPIVCRTRPQLTTVVPGSLPGVEAGPVDGAIETVELTLPPPRVTVERTDRSAAEESAALNSAELVLCVGNVVEGEADIAALRGLLARLERATGLPGALAASRRVTDAGHLPRQIQVGLTGRAIAPRLYIGVGIRGAAYHMVGIKHAGTVVAINSDPAAPILQDCDIGIVGDWRAALPMLVEAMEPRLAPAPAAAK